MGITCELRRALIVFPTGLRSAGEMRFNESWLQNSPLFFDFWGVLMF
jgi:hypothetical protein